MIRSDRRIRAFFCGMYHYLDFIDALGLRLCPATILARMRPLGVNPPPYLPQLIVSKQLPLSPLHLFQVSPIHKERLGV